MDEFEKIKSNIQKIEEDISNSCLKSGRERQDVKLIVASKYANCRQLKIVYNLGIKEFGENRANELTYKANILNKEDVTWHFIGHLQSNKVKKVVPICEYIHSVDNLDTLEAIDKFCKKINKVQKILVEVNVSGEKTKFGLKVGEVNSFFKDALKYRNIMICGLMTMAPFTSDFVLIRGIFRKLREIQNELKLDDSFKHYDLKELSMGMSNDYKIAIEEGATMIRIGSAIFK
jgi:hypothetical protein